MGVVMFRSLLLPIVAVAALIYMVWHVSSSSKASPQTEPLLSPPRSPFDDAVAGVGLIEPRSENIEVAAVVPGTVAELAVKVGDKVSAGDLLFRLDDRDRQADLTVRRAELAAAQSTLARLEQMPRAEDIPLSEARVKRFEADLTLRQDQLRRTKELVVQKALTEQELVERQQAYNSSQAQLAEARADDARLKDGAWEADLAVARAQVQSAAALVEQARVELDRLAVRSPIRGTVLKVDVRPGEYVGTPPGKPLVILGDVERLHVRVDIDEQDLPRLERGMSGQAYVRGEAKRALDLSFVRIEPFAEPKRSLTGAGNERIDTRVLQVIYAIDATPHEVWVGQQVDVFLNADGASSEGLATVAEVSTTEAR
jgi:HlyD family secretion protein